MSSPLDRNLAELLRRHEPVAVDEGFRERLGARVRDEAARLAAARRAARAPAPRAARRASIPTLAAAASLIALLVAGWALWGGPSAAPSLRDVLGRAGAAERAHPAADWHAPAGALSLQDGYLEAASAGRATLSIDLPQLGSVELPAGLPTGVEYLHASLQRRDTGPTRVRLLRGAGIAHLPFGDVPLPQGCDLLLDRDGAHTLSLPDSLPDAGPAPSLPSALDAAPTSLVPPEEVAVATPARLVGQIRLPGDALPVPEARLILVQSDITAEGPRQYVHTLPAGDGQFDWPDLPHGRFHLFVQVPGFAADITRHISIDSTLVLPPLDIRLDPGRTLRGRVVDSYTGAPVAGAVVLSDSDAPAVLLGLVEGALIGQYLPLTHTDEAGLFELRHLRAGVQVLRATHAGRAPAFGEVAADVGEVSVDEPPKSADVAGRSADGDEASADGAEEVAKAVDVELRLPAGGTVGGEVRRDDGTLWSGAELVTSFVNPLAHCMSYGYGITDEQGQYRMEDLPAAEGMVLLVGPEEAERRIPPMEAVSVPAGGMVRVNFGPQAPAANEGTLVGYLAEADGKPAGGRMVSVLSEAWEASGHFETSMVDEQGNWRIEKLPADTYYVYVVFDVQYGVVVRVAQVDVPALGEARCSAQLAAGSLAGHILSPDGAPLPRTDLVVMERQATGAWDFVAHIMADDAGAWECMALAPGLYRAIGFDRKGAFAAARSEPVLVGTGKVDGVTVQLTLGGTLRVHVAAADGTPADRALIHLRDTRGEEWNFVQFQYTGSDGSLTLPGVPAGMWDVEAVPAAGGSIRTSVEVRAGEAARADLVLPR